MGKASFNILPHYKLIIEKYSGSFLISEYKRMKNEEFEHPDFNPVYDVLADLRDACYEMKEPEPDKVIMSVTDYLKSNRGKIGKRKCAFIAIKPDQVVSSVFYSEYVKDLPIDSKVFSTIEAALNWLAVKNIDSIKDSLK